MKPHLLNHLLEESAQSDPAALAVVDRDRRIDYGELESTANRVAHLLIESGVGPSDRVGLYLDKSLEAVIGIHAIHKAGATYVPLDPKAPPNRLAYIAADCGVRHMVSSVKQASRWQSLVALGAPLESILVLDKGDAPEPPPGAKVFTTADVATQEPTAPDIARIDQDLAYILYTSGSTGSPKGVMLSHRNALAFVDWTVGELGVTPWDRLSSHAPLHFDLSVFDLFAATHVGASVSLVPTGTSVFPIEVARFIQTNQITIWYSVPSILSLLTQHAGLESGDLPSLRHVVFAGEVFPSKYLSRLMGLVPDAAFHNWYGPTETNVCTAYRVTSAPDPDGPDIPIGRPISNVETAVLTSDDRLVAPGDEGELVVRGATVMVGYWGDADKTAARLVPGLLPGSNDPVYRTGDLVVEDTEGNYRFMGRRDHQIKSRGYRIELGEIETALYAHPGVTECAVVAVPDEVVSNLIKAYVVAAGDMTSADLTSWCSNRIPRYMLPDAFEFLDRLPKTSTGKIDRQALPTEI